MASVTANRGASKKIYYEGWLDKKSPSGIRGFRKWQKRWFQIHEKAIVYMKNQGDEKQLGQIPLQQIVECEYLPDKRIGCRFDIRVKNLRVYSLNGETIDSSKAWVAAVKENVNRCKSANDPDKVGSATKEAAVKLTRLQLGMLRAKTGIDPHKVTTPAEQKAMLTIKMQYETDADVLRFVLHHLMDYKNGYFDFDMTDEKDDALDVEDIKVDEKTGLPPSPPPAGSTAAAAAVADTTPAVRRCRVEICNAPCKGDTDYCEWHQNKRHKTIPIAQPKGLGNHPGMSPALMASMAARNNAAAGGPISGANTASESKAVTQLKPEEIKGMNDMLHSKEFIRHVCAVFIAADRTAHGLAVRLLWVLFRGIMNKADAAKEFAQFMEIHCSGVKFNMEIKNALLAILLQTPAKVVDTTDKLTVSFYMPVHNPSTWQALLVALKISDFPTRKAALEDVNTILHDNFENCRSLRRNEKWQSWIYEILTDVPKNKNADAVLKTVFAYCINVVTLIHYQYFMKKPYFAEVLMSSLYRLHNFGASSSECQRVGGTMLAALSSKLGAQHKNFSSDKDAVDWKNLYSLTRIIRKFVFQSAWWQSGNTAWEADAPGAPAVAPTAAVDPAASPVKVVPKMIKHEFVLSRARVAKGDRTFDDSPMEPTEQGLHWTDEGKAADVALVVKVADLFKALRLHDYNPDLNPNMAPKEKEFIQTAVREFEFWEDSKKFLETVQLVDIEDRKLISYRKMGHFCEEWLASRSRSGRQSLLNDIDNILKDRAKADAKIATKKEALRAQSMTTPATAPTAAGTAADPTAAAVASPVAAASLPAADAPISAGVDMTELPPHLRQLQKQMSSLPAAT